MRAFDYYQPTRIRFGWGRVAEVGEVVAEYGKRCLLVSGPASGALAHVYERVKRFLKSAGVDVIHFDGVVPNPTTDSVDAGVGVATRCGVEVVLGVGGGSSVDTAKAIAVGATHEGKAWDYRLFSGRRITDKLLPVISVTTTSGTGTQVTPVAVVTNSLAKFKSALVDKLLCPRVSIVDPELTMTLPAHITASTGFDVFAHAFESYIHSGGSVYTDIHAVEALKLVVKYLPAAVQNGSDKEARIRMAWADTLAGLSIANSGTTLPHGIAMAIGGHAPHVMHGEALAAVYPEFMRYTYASAIERFAVVGRILDPRLEREPDEVAAQGSCEALNAFLRRIGMWLSLEDLGVPRDELLAIADDSVRLPDYTVNPRVPTRDEIFDMLEHSYRR